MGLDKVSGMLVAEKAWRDGSFAVTSGATSGIGTLPIVYFGTEEQKQKYLPKLATGEWIAAYALTEAGSARRPGRQGPRRPPPDGDDWILNGEKMFITNAGFADLFIVFAKVDGEHFTAFIVEQRHARRQPRRRREEDGHQGQLDAAAHPGGRRVPAENLLGEIGKGHKIAFNILNVGRFKLGAGTGGARS